MTAGTGVLCGFKSPVLVLVGKAPAARDTSIDLHGDMIQFGLV